MRLAFAALAGGAFRAPALDRWMPSVWTQSSSRPTDGTPVALSHHRWTQTDPDAADFREGGAA